MSEWIYVWIAYGLTWLVLTVYAGYVVGRARRAEAALRELPATEREES